MALRWHALLVAPLLAFPGLGPEPADEEPAGQAWVVEDPTGDLYDRLLTDVAAPPTKLTEAGDVTRLELRQENATSLTVAFTVVDLDETMTSLQAACVFVCYRVGYEGSFHVNGDDNREYSFNLGISFLPGLSAAPAPYAGICSLETKGDRHERGECRAVPAGTDYAANQVWLKLPRDMLVVGSGDLAEAAGPGDALTDFSAAAWVLFQIATPALWFFDQVPNEPPAPDYVFRTAPKVGGELRVETDAEYKLRTEGGGDGASPGTGPPRPAGIAPGQVKEFGFHVTNRGAQKRIVSLSPTLDGPGTGWNASAVPQVIVDANETVRVGVLVHAPAGAAHRDAVTLTVGAAAIDDPSLAASAELKLTAARTPTVAEPVLHLHARPRSARQGPASALDAVLPNYELAMNTQRQDALYPDAPVPMLARGFVTFRLDTPLADALALETEGIARLLLHVTGSAPAPQPVRFDAQLVLLPPVGDAQLLALGGRATDLTSSGVELAIDMPIATTESVHEAGEVWLQLRTSGGDLPGGSSILPSGFYGGTTYGTIDVAQSSLALPIVELPADRAVIAGGGDLRVAISLQEDRDPVEYVNPGETRRFNLTALNEESEAIELSWKVAASQATWRVWTDGAAKATLSPGNSTRLTVLARAPLDAAEGDQLSLNVTATPKRVGTRDAANAATADLRVVVTRGIDLPDDAPEGPSSGVKAKKDSKVPGPGLGLGLMALAVALALARRRPA